MPAVFYGKKTKSTPISVDEIEFLKIWREAGESTVVNLKEGKEEGLGALIYGYQRDAITQKLLHTDFYVFEKGQKMKISVPLEFIGEAPAVKAGGVIVKVMHEVEVEAEPKNLPHSLSVNISVLENFTSVALAKDIVLPEGVILTINPEDVVASVYEPKDEPKEEPAQEFDPTKVEVEKKGKEAKEGEETGAPEESEKKKEEEQKQVKK